MSGRKIFHSLFYFLKDLQQWTQRNLDLHLSLPLLFKALLDCAIGLALKPLLWALPILKCLVLSSSSAHLSQPPVALEHGGCYVLAD